MDPETFKCPYCDRTMPSLEGLRKHCRKHKVDAKRLYLELFCGGIEPTCKCGCKQPVKFLTIQEGFSTYKRGHISRIQNNWGHNKIALDKSHATTKRRYDAGEIQVWNKGLSKDTDKRVEALGVAGSHTLKTDPACQRQRSEHMSEQWKTGSIVAQTGLNHSHWKGGVSSLQQLVRSHLFRAWSRPIMERQRFTCQHCGKQSDLCVHHDKERFAVILQKAMEHFRVDDAMQLSFDQKQELSLWVVDYHVNNQVSGIVLCETCHKQEHQFN